MYHVIYYVIDKKGIWFIIEIEKIVAYQGKLSAYQEKLSA